MKSIIKAAMQPLLDVSYSLSSTGAVVDLTLFFALLCACIIIGHLLEENRWANESTTALILGLCSGVLVLLVSRGQESKILVFNEELLFLYLLPPIIFNAGFQIKKKQFFKNFNVILMFGVLGTVISFCVISLGAFFLFRSIGVKTLGIQECLAVGAILSAVESACTLQVLCQDETPFLHSAVFGEKVVNEATSLVLFNAILFHDFKQIDATIALNFLGTFLYQFFTSTFLGIMVGLLSAYIIKARIFGRHITDREVAMMMLMAYLSYMLAELMEIVGSLTVFFCGVVMSHYTWHNITESARVTTKHAFATISFIAETFIFLYVGMDALDIEKWRTSTGSVGTSIVVSSSLFLLVLLGRAAFVFPLANIKNCLKKKESSKIKLREQFTIWWGGLMRGAVTIALAYKKFSASENTSPEDSALVITSTIAVVLFSTVVLGSMTKPLIETVLLNHVRAVISCVSDFPSLQDLLLTLEEGHQGDKEKKQGDPMTNSLRMLIKYPHHTVHYFWRKIDDKFMRPVFGGRGFVPVIPGSPSASEDNNDNNNENHSQVWEE